MQWVSCDQKWLFSSIILIQARRQKIYIEVNKTKTKVEQKQVILTGVENMASLEIEIFMDYSACGGP